MMKKTLALLLAVLAVMGCMFCVSAADGDEPQTSPSGYAVGQILKPGDTISSSYETCESLAIVYSVSNTDAEFVTSEWQKKFSDESVRGVATFRDLTYSSSEDYNGSLAVLAQGDKVTEIETKYREYKSATEIYTSLSEDELKELRIRKEFDLTIDYDYAHTTYNQYTFITSWEITSIRDDESTLEIRVKAVFETREPTSFQTFQEKLYTAWCKFLDKIGDGMLFIVPRILAFWAKVLGKNR